MVRLQRKLYMFYWQLLKNVKKKSLEYMLEKMNLQKFGLES